MQFCALTVLLSPQMALAGMALYLFSFENDGDLTNAPFGTLKVVEGFDATENVDTLTFTIDLDELKLGASVDIHEFGFQLDFAGTPDLVPKPQTVGSGANTYTLTQLASLSAVAGFGSTKWDYMLNFGNGANPTLDPVSFTIGATGLSLSALSLPDQPYKNGKEKLGTVSNFAVHAQSTSATPGSDSEGLGGFYVDTVSAVTPELSNLCTAIAAIVTGFCLSLRRKSGV